MKTLFLSFLALITSPVLGQYTFNPNDVLQGKRKLPQVLLVGTFHFDYPNMDVVKTTADKQVDVLSAQKQVEMEQLVSYIAQFKPTKIVVEARPGAAWLAKKMVKYRAYKNGTRKLGRDEMEQITFRLLTQFKLDTLYGGDAPTIFDELYDSKDSLALRPTLDKIFTGWQNYNYKCNEPVCALQDSVSKIEEQIELKWPLLDVFKYLNSDNSLNRNYGAYFDGEYFTQGQYRGADALAMDWYNRNLRIFRNIQSITTSPDDRILVLFGAGHIAILKQLFECAPNYKFVKFKDLAVVR